ncbi:unnamed protein product [Coffea canephora]|uniref:HSF-type DNA-binding domain-containing protein n=1 Tax=Coffea canephora TaxID=49390 RepID=A0A068U135_COFCA|nr:unnamed protein product [Coffea canephora]
MALMLDNCEGILLSLDSHKSVPAPFLTKTYQLVDDPSTDHIVSWGEDDTTFVVWRPPEFARDLLPNYFKHNNFSSFVRQLNTYGFRKIVPDRWEFANEFFKKGEKHLLCEIHRRKTAQPQVAINHHHHHHPLNNPISSPTFFPNSISSSSVTALSEDNERLRRSNNMLMSELAHMRKLYNDIIYFVQNHVKPVAPSNTFPSSLLPSSATPIIHNTTNSSSSLMQKPLNQLIGFHHHHYPKQNEPMDSSNISRTKLFGVPLHSKKRLHPECSNSMVETNKARLVMEKDDLGLNLMPPSPC